MDGWRGYGEGEVVLERNGTGDLFPVLNLKKGF